jgi:hypothetical protein
MNDLIEKLEPLADEKLLFRFQTALVRQRRCPGDNI